MRAFFLLMLFCASAHAELLGKAETQLAFIEIHSDKGICVGEARRALYVPKDGKPAIVGCWVTDGRAFQIAFLDGDVGQIPASAIKLPTRL